MRTEQAVIWVVYFSRSTHTTQFVEGWYFCYLIFSRFILFTFKKYSLQNCIRHLKKTYFFCHDNFMEKAILPSLSCSKMNLKISHKLRQTNIFVKGYKKSKIDFSLKTTVELVSSVL